MDGYTAAVFLSADGQPPAAATVVDVIGHHHSHYDDDNVVLVDSLLHNNDFPATSSLMDDNASDSCYYSSSSNSFCLPCGVDDKPLWFLVLRWIKMTFLKMARSYHVKPLLLIGVPLVTGLLLGYLLGRWTSTKLLCNGNTGGKTVNSMQKKKKTLLERYVFDFVPRILAACTASLVWFFHQGIAVSTFEKQRTTIRTTTKEGDDCCQPPTSQTRSSSSSDLTLREERVRTNLKSNNGTVRESGVPIEDIPRHVAVIMDGNRRYGKAKYDDASRGHWEGSSKLVEFAKWCVAEKIQVLTVFAFSTENWNRDPIEVAALMQIFVTYCDELRVEALDRNIKIVALSTDQDQIPTHVREGVRRMVDETRHCTGMTMNICLSYGSRSEMVAAARSLAQDAANHKLDPNSIDEAMLGERLLTHDCGGDPDILIRTSGEVRISNFLLWQLAYTELFFVEKPWPAMEKDDLLHVIRTFARGRSRRYGK